MGLAVVRQIVRQLGGAIHVVSSAAQGTSVLILLPCARETVYSDGVDTIPEPVRELQPEGGSTVLVVEDEPTLVTAISNMLRRKGFGVVEATNGTAALELVRDGKNRMDAMLLDVTLPGAASREVFEEAGRLRPGLVVILMSAHSRESVDASLAGLRVAHFIRKPFRMEDLLKLLQDTLSARSVPPQIGPPERRRSVSR
jgi:DNA-binding NtrC family response regulator